VGPFFAGPKRERDEANCLPAYWLYKNDKKRFLQQFITAPDVCVSLFAGKPFDSLCMWRVCGGISNYKVSADEFLIKWKKQKCISGAPQATSFSRYL
jgi:hypothetical protein